jgi:hypothetical protein
MPLTNPAFQDFEADDALDHAPPAPEQVAYRIHRIRRYLSRLAGNDIGDFFDMTDEEQTHALQVGEDIVAFVTSHDPSERAKLARVIHEARAEQDDLPTWAELDESSRAVAEALAKVLAEWLIREGAWR